MSQLMLHRGGRLVERAELEAAPVPPPTHSWFPISHGQVAQTVELQLAQAGFGILKSEYALARNDHRMFATYTLQSPLAEGVSLAVGIRNSTDKSFPLGFAAGSRVFVCDNLSFNSELVVTKKHTKYGHDRFRDTIARSILSLQAYQKHEAARIERLRTTPVTLDESESLILRAYETGLLSNRTLPLMIREWRKPSHEEFSQLTAWALMNCFTEVFKVFAVSNPAEHAKKTIELGSMLDQSFDIEEFRAEPSAVAA